MAKKARTKSQTGRRAREAGLEWENKVKNLLIDAGVPTVRSNQARGEVMDGADLTLNAVLRDGFLTPVSRNRSGSVETPVIECKRRTRDLSNHFIARTVKPGKAVAVKLKGIGEFMAISVEEYVEYMKWRFEGE